jgi:uncharacterized membrane protein YhhN
VARPRGAGRRGAGAAGLASFALGTCHDSGAFCADRFSSAHVEAYAGGVLLVSSAVGLLTLTVTRRRGVRRPTGPLPTSRSSGRCAV